MKPHSLPQQSLWRFEGLCCLDLGAERSEKFSQDTQEAYISMAHNGKGCCYFPFHLWQPILKLNIYSLNETEFCKEPVFEEDYKTLTQNKQKKCLVCSEEVFHVHTIASPFSSGITKQKKLFDYIQQTFLNKQPKWISIPSLDFVAHTLCHSKRTTLQVLWKQWLCRILDSSTQHPISVE